MTLEKPLHFFFLFFEGPLFFWYELCHPPNPLNQKMVFWHSGFGRTFSPIYVTAWLPVREDHVKPVWTGGGAHLEDPTTRGFAEIRPAGGARKRRRLQLSAHGVWPITRASGPRGIRA